MLKVDIASNTVVTPKYKFMIESRQDAARAFVVRRYASTMLQIGTGWCKCERRPYVCLDRCNSGYSPMPKCNPSVSCLIASVDYILLYELAHCIVL